jgi:hypothetical protein
VGTANLDNISLNAALLQGRTVDTLVRAMGRPLLGLGALFGSQYERRSSEINALIFDGIAGHASSGVVATLRRALWSEHLGLSAAAPELQTMPATGWLNVWRDRAEAKRAQLEQAPSTILSQRLLPWPRDSEEMLTFERALVVDPFDEIPLFRNVSAQDPLGHLKLLGVDTSALGVRAKVRSFSFEDGKFVDDPDWAE